MMIEGKTEEAAKMYAFHKCDEKDIDLCDLDYLLSNAFHAGINWFLDNLWHDASEEPKEGMLVLTDTQSIANKGHICWQTVKLNPKGFIHNWSNYVKATKVTRWLYIDDLLKGGK